MDRAISKAFSALSKEQRPSSQAFKCTRDAVTILLFTLRGLKELLHLQMVYLVSFQECYTKLGSALMWDAQLSFEAIFFSSVGLQVLGARFIATIFCTCDKRLVGAIIGKHEFFFIYPLHKFIFCTLGMNNLPLWGLRRKKSLLVHFSFFRLCTALTGFPLDGGYTVFTRF